MIGEFGKPRPITPTDFDTLVLCAARYALGRMTYIVHDICEIVRSHASLIGPQTLAVMIRDIEEAAARAQDQPRWKPLGHECDAREWMSLLDFLKGLP